MQHSGQKSQVMETFVTVRSGQATSVLEVAQFLMVVSTKLQRVLNSTVAAVTYRIVATLVFGVIGIVVTVQ